MSDQVGNRNVGFLIMRLNFLFKTRLISCSHTARYGDYFRLLANGNYKVTAAVAVEDENGQEEIITRITCVTVYNDPRDYNEAQRVDFDFRDLSKKEHTYGCKPRQVISSIVRAVLRKSLSLGFPTRFDTNQAVQPQ